MLLEILTIGHSTHAWADFAALLRQHAVTVVADVRSAPYSRYNPHYNREELTALLHAVGVKYVFLGRELGARSEDAACYVDGQVQYDRLAQTPLFQAGLDRVRRGAETHRIALLCAEKEPLECHRCLLVGQALATTGVAVTHILADGSAEPHARTLDRLLDRLGLPHHDLFRSPDDLLAEAVRVQSARIAYVDDRRRFAPETEPS